jgi:hypothetical protein
MSADDLKPKVIEIFASQLPETARVMNPPAVCEEGEAVPPCTEDEDLPPQETYDRYEAVIDELVEQGALQTREVFGMKTYSLATGWEAKRP